MTRVHAAITKHDWLMKCNNEPEVGICERVPECVSERVLLDGGDDCKLYTFKSLQRGERARWWCWRERGCRDEALAKQQNL